MGSVPFRENSRPTSLILDEERGELVRPSLGKVGKRGRGDDDGGLNVKAAMALRSHSEAERRRRERINGHLATLRSMVPSDDKLDKSALLGEVISHVQKLKTNVTETAKGFSTPSVSDEVKVEFISDKMNSGSFSIKASISCEDRPDLLEDLKQTFWSLQIKIVQAELCTLGGRIKNDFVLACEPNVNDEERNLFTTNVEQALRSVLDKATSFEFVLPNSFDGSKRDQTTPALKIKTGHQDVVHDVSIDSYGKQIATASSDSTIKIMEGNEHIQRVGAPRHNVFTEHKSSVSTIVWVPHGLGLSLANGSSDRNTHRCHHVF